MSRKCLSLVKISPVGRYQFGGNDGKGEKENNKEDRKT